MLDPCKFTGGTVGDPPWGVTLGAFAASGVSGELTVETEDGKRYVIGFRGGSIVAASSPLASDSVARVALTSHLVASSQVAAIAKAVATSDRDEVEVIAELAKLSAEQATKLRQRLLAQRVARTFSIDPGRYTFDPNIAPQATSGELSVGAAIFLGARMHLSDLRLADDVRRFGSRFVLKSETIDLARFGLTDLERPIVQALRIGTSLAELDAKHREIEPRTTQAVIYTLIACNACEGLPARPRSHELVIPGVTSGPSTSQRLAASGPTTSQRLGASGPTTSQRLGASVPPTSPRLDAPVPPPPPRLDDDAISRAPTVSFDPAARPRGGTSPRLGVVQPRAQTSPPAVARLRSETASQPRPRAETSPPLGRADTAPQVPRARTTSSPPSLPRTFTPRRSSGFAARETIASGIALVERGADHFSLLGVAHDAPVDTIRTAYVALACQLHPDKLPDLAPAETQLATRLFGHINLAFAVLTDPARRDSYVAGLGDAPRRIPAGTGTIPNPDKERSADEAVKRGLLALKREELPLAISELVHATELAPSNVDHAAVLAWARFCASSDKHSIAPEIRRALERAIQKSPRPVTARFYLGRVERMLGRVREALHHFHEVILLDPAHAEAAAEIRLLEPKRIRR